MNKKAQGLSINAIILIILGLAVLVVLVLGFMMGWEKIMPWMGEKNNIDVVSSACETACLSQSLYNYCSAPRDLSDGTNIYEGVTCYTLASLKDFQKYGIKDCPELDCKSVIKCDAWKSYDPVTKNEIAIDDKLVSGDLEDYCDNTLSS